MFPSEFLLIITWVLFPAVATGWVVLATYHLRIDSRSMLRTVQAGMMLAVLSFCLSIVFVLFGLAQLSRWFGLRDEPVTWAPFAFVAVFLALPASIWMMRRPIAPEGEK